MEAFGPGGGRDARREYTLSKGSTCCATTHPRSNKCPTLAPVQSFLRLLQDASSWGYLHNQTGTQ
ncbi:hypothetical protein E2C01_033352 [Portunus trituberculatus]|uniref:Uncharacterized protein n=1 Tax=Portunus trituberculatus TaxID=210409 RepID=A0A5B7F3Z5_PORTR|nr:hypothetical protein [Portunus trituberculatus]